MYPSNNQEVTMDVLQEHYLLSRATTDKRFANYIIDVIGVYLSVVLLSRLLAIVSPSMIDELENFANRVGILDRISTLFLYAIYMSLVEGIFKGKSLGKIFTGTVAVNLDGSTLEFSKAIARGFSRAVPFCVFSALAPPAIRGETDGLIP